MADPEQFLWPLRAVSKDPTNLTKLDANNNVLTSIDERPNHMAANISCTTRNQNCHRFLFAPRATDSNAATGSRIVTKANAKNSSLGKRTQSWSQADFLV